MNDSKLKDALRSYYAADAASPDASARKRTLLLVEAEAARACGGTREADYIPLWRFVASQARFVRPWAWMLQIALLACMLVLVGEIGPHSGSPIVVMAASALSVAIAAPSVFKSFETRVCEMEYSCRFSCVQVLASRLLLFGLADVLWITLAVAAVPTLAGIDALRVLLYACTPFFCSCAACFYALAAEHGVPPLVRGCVSRRMGRGAHGLHGARRPGGVKAHALRLRRPLATPVKGGALALLLHACNIERRTRNEHGTQA